MPVATVPFKLCRFSAKKAGEQLIADVGETLQRNGMKFKTGTNVDARVVSGQFFIRPQHFRSLCMHFLILSRLITGCPFFNFRFGY
ncbi:hypothetical protein [Candidatus Nitrotoga sp. M5]|uniref:hypothetical protein n=1 Tax=Candidatus Nitrotoga sp. M5 TaxID=2890409 RepID=UPI001EF2B61F|nr:hypothetical protein [Candidatus Nitrotoga sp. M5]CAH1386199.1 hypothetical protein NTGM5_220044 [Candidatus Nitrotoga sp. M5]